MYETRHLVARRRRTAADMADYSSVAPPSSNAGGGMNDAFKDALQRARQVRPPLDHLKIDHKIIIASVLFFFENQVSKQSVSALSAVNRGITAS